MRTAARTIGTALVAIGLVACERDPTAEQKRTGALATRVEQLEQRLAATERGLEPVEGLRNEVASLDRRVTSAETSLRGNPPPTSPPTTVAPSGTPATPPAGARPSTPSGPSAWGGPTTREVRQDRRAQLRTLTQEFRTRLYQFRGEQPDSTAEQQQRLQDTLQWHREQRRAILRGEGRTDQ